MSGLSRLRQFVCILPRRGIIRGFSSAPQPQLPHVVWEDDHFCFISKPRGQPTAGSQDQNSLDGDRSTHAWAVDHGVRNGWRTMPRLLHRLDRPVSGLILYAKTPNAFRFARGMMQGHRFMRKEYLAVVTGRPLHERGVLTGSYGKTPDGQRFTFRSSGVRKAETKFEVLASREHPTMGAVSLLRLQLVTGRQHQLRATCRALGCPIVGDDKYGGHEWPVTMLHAARVAFDTPTGRRYDVRLAPPSDWEASARHAADWREACDAAGVSLDQPGVINAPDQVAASALFHEQWGLFPRQGRREAGGAGGRASETGRQQQWGEGEGEGERGVGASNSSPGRIQSGSQHHSAVHLDRWQRLRFAHGRNARVLQDGTLRLQDIVEEDSSRQDAREQLRRAGEEGLAAGSPQGALHGGAGNSLLELRASALQVLRAPFSSTASRVSPLMAARSKAALGAVSRAHLLDVDPVWEAPGGDSVRGDSASRGSSSSLAVWPRLQPGRDVEVPPTLRGTGSRRHKKEEHPSHQGHSSHGFSHSSHGSGGMSKKAWTSALRREHKLVGQLGVPRSGVLPLFGHLERGLGGPVEEGKRPGEGHSCALTEVLERLRGVTSGWEARPAWVPLAEALQGSKGSSQSGDGIDGVTSEVGIGMAAAAFAQSVGGRLSGSRNEVRIGNGGVTSDASVALPLDLDGGRDADLDRLLRSATEEDVDVDEAEASGERGGSFSRERQGRGRGRGFEQGGGHRGAGGRSARRDHRRQHGQDHDGRERGRRGGDWEDGAARGSTRRGLRQEGWDESGRQ